MKRPTLFVEGCAGLAAVSLRLHGGRHARPPVSRMGNKAGYADTILRVLGLRPGQGADAYLWCEPDPGCRLLLEAYRDPALARGAAEVLRGWAGEEPRALWERLRAEGPPVLEPLTAYEVARVAFLWQNSYRRGDPDSGCDDGQGRANPAHNRCSGSGAALAAAWETVTHPPATIAPDLRDVAPIPGALLYLDPPYSDVPAVVPPMLAAERLSAGACHRSETDSALCALGLNALREPVSHLRVAVLEMLRAAGVEMQVLDSVVERVVVDVVDDLVWSQWSSDMPLHHKTVFSDISSIITHDSIPSLNPPLALSCAPLGGQRLPLRGHLRDFALRCKALPGTSPEFTQALAWADSAVPSGSVGIETSNERTSTDLARDLERHCRLRVEVRRDINTKISQPGRKTTGYGADLPRAEALAIARRWQAAGATVAISEAVPLPLPGWHHVRIDGERVGQKRTFSRQQEEWLTLSRPPAWVPAVQGSLFALEATP